MPDRRGERFPAGKGRKLEVLASGVALAVIYFSTGCSRSLVIHQADYINTAMHSDRPNVTERTGEPLEVHVVCVTAQDLQKPCNKDLDPNAKSPITTQDWFSRLPENAGAGGATPPQTFDLPANQIYLLSDVKRGYGTPIHDRLRGAKDGGPKSVVIDNIEFPGGAGDKSSVIYVFPYFRGAGNKLLPNIQPAKFHPPSKYGRELHVTIGTEKDRQEQIVHVGPPDAKP